MGNICTSAWPNMVKIAEHRIWLHKPAMYSGATAIVYTQLPALSKQLPHSLHYSSDWELHQSLHQSLEPRLFILDFVLQLWRKIVFSLKLRDKIWNESLGSRLTPPRLYEYVSHAKTFGNKIVTLQANEPFQRTTANKPIGSQLKTTSKQLCGQEEINWNKIATLKRTTTKQFCGQQQSN